MERHLRPVDEHVDVVVVGARVAGAATALHLARAGHSVAVVDRARFPSDTLSTHAIARTGMVQLARMGVLPALHGAGTPAVRDVSFHSPEGVVRRRLKERAGIDHLLAPRRHVLDPILLAAAEQAGARVLLGATVRDVELDQHGRATGVVGEVVPDPAALAGEGRTGPLRIRARHVVGADGWRSTVARRVGAAVVADRPSTAATHYRYVAGLDGAGFEYHVADGLMSGVFHTNDGEACVWVCCPSDRTGAVRAPGADKVAAFDELVAAGSPALAERLRATEATSPVRGACDLPNRVLAGAGPGWWLVGDAGYHRDPVTGHGISDALRDAEVLAASIDGHLAGCWDERWARARYVLRRHRSITPVFDLTCRMAAFPPLDQFVPMQKRLGELVDAEANRLALQELPVVGPIRELLGAAG